MKKKKPGPKQIATVSRRASASNDPALLFPRRGKDTRTASLRHPSAVGKINKGHHARAFRGGVPRRGIGSFFKKIGKGIGKATHSVLSKVPSSVKDFLEEEGGIAGTGMMRAIEGVDKVANSLSKGGLTKNDKQLAKAAAKSAGKSLKRHAGKAAGNALSAGKQALRESAGRVGRGESTLAGEITSHANKANRGIANFSNQAQATSQNVRGEAQRASKEMAEAAQALRAVAGDLGSTGRQAVRDVRGAAGFGARRGSKRKR